MAGQEHRAFGAPAHERFSRWGMALALAAATPALTTLKNFRGEYEAHVREGRCTVPAPWRRRHAAPVGSH